MNSVLKDNIPESMSKRHSVPGAQSRSSEIETPKEIAERYTFIKKLGEGTQGDVFQAVRSSDGKVLAVKKLRIDSVNTWKEYDLFRREADVLSSIHTHGVAEFYEAIECLNQENPSAYIVQELIEGRSLQMMLRTGFRFTVSRIFKMALGLIDLLEKLHTHNPPVIHRDIKPGNIIMKPSSITNDFEPWLIDFGAVANPTVQKGGSTVAGTYGYMPPEQLLGRPEPASDIYALGVTIVYMLCGVEPVDMRVADFRLVIDPYLETVPRPIVSVLHRMLDPKLESRLCSYDELRNIFERFSRDDYRGLEDAGSLTDEVINEKLARVNAFNQAGNLELWMQLSEQTPRAVPRELLKTILTHGFVDENAMLARKILVDLRYLGGLLLVVFVILMVYICADHPREQSVFWMCVILGIIGFICLGFLFDLVYTFSQKVKNHKTLIEKIDLYEKTDDIEVVRYIFSVDNESDIPVLTLLRFGRKGIATVVDFEDIPVAEKYRVTNRNGDLFSRSKVQFRLRYRFNPPDDASADDLIHQIIIYRYQTEGLEPGMPIPILYFINPQDNSDVMSIPYPYPFEEIIYTHRTLVNKVNFYCRTVGGN